MYNYYPEELTSSLIYANINQKEVLDYMYGYNVPLNSYIKNIFRNRVDNNPGAWVEFFNNKLVLVDFADDETNHIDIIRMVMLYYNLSYSNALSFLYDKFILRKNIIVQPAAKINTNYAKERVVIRYAIRKYTTNDIKFWEKRDISIEQLSSDKVYSCAFFEFYSRRLRKLIQISNSIYKLSFIQAHFISRAVKIYQPEDKMRFITNCNETDIGCVQTINYNIPYIIITKSYKDCRILLNLGYNSIYILNETALPDYEALWFLYLFDYVYILMDNDAAGIKHSNTLNIHLRDVLNFKGIITVVKYDFWNDTDSYYLNDKEGLKEFLRNKIHYVTI